MAASLAASALVCKLTVSLVIKAPFVTERILLIGLGLFQLSKGFFLNVFF